MVWLKLHSDPVMIFYHDRAELSEIGGDYLIYMLLESVGSIRNEVALFGGKENSNTSVQLVNSSWECSALFAVPPLRKKAELYRSGETEPFFTGIVSRVTFSGSICRLDLEA